MGKECGMHGNDGNLEEIFDWKTGRKETVQKTCVNMEDNIEIDYKELYQDGF